MHTPLRQHLAQQAIKQLGLTSPAEIYDSSPTEDRLKDKILQLIRDRRLSDLAGIIADVQQDRHHGNHWSLGHVVNALHGKPCNGREMLLGLAQAAVFTAVINQLTASQPARAAG